MFLREKYKSVMNITADIITLDNNIIIEEILEFLNGINVRPNCEDTSIIYNLNN